MKDRIENFFQIGKEESNVVNFFGVDYIPKNMVPHPHTSCTHKINFLVHITRTRPQHVKKLFSMFSKKFRYFNEITSKYWHEEYQFYRYIFYTEDTCVQFILVEEEFIFDILSQKVISSNPLEFSVNKNKQQNA